jgi:pyruvate dehydrogenase E1 component
MPAGVEEGIVRGIYKLAKVDAGAKAPHVHLFGSGTILREALRAQQILADRYKVSSQAWSVTSYTELRRDAQACDRWNLLHPGEKPKQSYLEQILAGEQGPFIASSDYIRAISEQISPWVPGGLTALGTDGLGRSETREHLRRHFEVDAECITLAALRQLAKRNQFDKNQLPQAIKDLGIDPDKIDPMIA